MNRAIIISRKHHLGLAQGALTLAALVALYLIWLRVGLPALPLPVGGGSDDLLQQPSVTQIVARTSSLPKLDVARAAATSAKVASPGERAPHVAPTTKTWIAPPTATPTPAPDPTPPPTRTPTPQTPAALPQPEQPPAQQESPQSPTPPLLPDVPDLPNLPGVPNVPNVPLPQLPPLPTVPTPQLPHVPTTTLPSLP